MTRANRNTITNGFLLDYSAFLWFVYACVAFSEADIIAGQYSEMELSNTCVSFRISRKREKFVVYK